MADHFPGEIEIGGDIERSVLDELIQLIIQEDGKFDYDTAWLEEGLEEAFTTKESVIVNDSAACMGEFTAITEFLVKHKIPFDSHSDARYEYEAIQTYYRCEETMEEAGCFFCTQSGNDILLAFSTIESIVNNGELDEKQKVEEFRKILAQRSPLPLLNIID